MSQQLALEKMERTNAQADLDAIKTQKPDTSELDAVRADLAALSKSHKEAIDNSTKLEAELAEKEKEIEEIKGDMLMAIKELETHKLEADAKQKTQDADYKDLMQNMTELVEAEQKKTLEASARLDELAAKAKESDTNLSAMMKRIADADEAAEALKIKIAAQDQAIDELEAALKVKEAEIAEAKVRETHLLLPTASC